MASSREHRLVDAFVTLADTLVADYDVIDLLDMLVRQCCDPLGAHDAGILLVSDSGGLEVVASSSERSRLIGLMQLGAGEGPCIDAFETGRTVISRGHADAYARWPGFAVAAHEQGYASVYAIPLRLRSETVGSLNLFLDGQSGLSDADALAARGLADVATIGILHERAMRESDLARTQLQHALDSRVLIEQAKGVIAQSENVDMDEAFAQLRARARSTGARISEVAREMIAHARDARGSHPAT